MLDAAGVDVAGGGMENSSSSGLQANKDRQMEQQQQQNHEEQYREEQHLEQQRVADTMADEAFEALKAKVGEQPALLLPGRHWQGGAGNG